jgi:hypothetical protein
LNGTNGTGGSTGATGATGAGISQYGYIYNEDAEVVAIETDITFSANGVLVGIAHAPGTSQIVVGSAGDYKIEFSVSGVEPGQFALFVNGAPSTDNTTYGSGAGTQQNTGQAILTLAAGDILTVRNHSSAAAVTLQTLAGGTATNVNASVVIMKLN